MRLHSSLVSIAALLACCEAVSSATDETKLSKDFSIHNGFGNENKMLRRGLQPTETYRGEAVDDERTINLGKIFGLEKNAPPNVFTRGILKKMKKDDAFKLEMFAKWEQEKISVGEIAKKLKVPYRKRNLALLLEYINHVNPTKASDGTRNRRVRFGDVDVRYFDTDEMLEWLRHFGR